MIICTKLFGEIPNAGGYFHVLVILSIRGKICSILENFQGVILFQHDSSTSPNYNLCLINLYPIRRNLAILAAAIVGEMETWVIRNNGKWSYKLKNGAHVFISCLLRVCCAVSNAKCVTIQITLKIGSKQWLEMVFFRTFIQG